MADEILLDKVQSLSDLELAALICLVAQEHCIIDTEPDTIDELVQELEQVRCSPIIRVIYANSFRLLQKFLDSPTLWSIAPSIHLLMISHTPYSLWRRAPLARTPP